MLSARHATTQPSCKAVRQGGAWAETAWPWRVLLGGLGVLLQLLLLPQYCLGIALSLVWCWLAGARVRNEAVDITIVWPWRRKRSISWASVSEVLLRHDGGKNVSASLVLQDGEHVALDAFAHIETLLQGAAERGIPVYRVGCWPKHGPTKPQALMVFAHGELVSQAGQLKGWHSLFAWADSSAVANDLAPEVLIAAEMLAAGLGKPCDGLPSLLANWVANAGASPDVVVDHFIPQLKNALDAMSADVAMERALYLAGLWQRLR